MNDQVREGTAMGDAMVQVRSVRKAYGDREVLRGIDLDVRAGEVMCLLGPSGSGKSTLLRCINNLESIDEGRIRVDGELIGHREVGDRLQVLAPKAQAAQRKNIGMVFQRFNLFAHMTALENVVEAPLRVSRRDRAEVKKEALELLDRVGLADHAGHYPAQLSGGQQQRVAIARALAMHPRLMLFDEPTSALDPELVGEVLEVMRGLAGSGMTMIVVTHEIDFARDVGDSLVFLDQGVIIEQGNPREVLATPQTDRMKQFLAVRHVAV